MAVQTQGCTPAIYRRRCPVDTPLYRAVQNHLKTFLALCHDDWEDERIAPHAERELRAYLQCGILANGFARARCGQCGHDARALPECGAAGTCRCGRLHSPLRLLAQSAYPLPCDATVRIAANDRRGLERVLRSRQHRHRYHGVLAPNAPLRTALAPEAAQSSPVQTSGEAPDEAPHRFPARYLWAMLPARIYEAFPLTCPQCGAEIPIVAIITETSIVQRILNHIGESAIPPRIAPARGPPLWDEDDSKAIFLDEERFTGDPLAQPEPEDEFDQCLSW